ncbi:MAG TPA: YggS family pyridoxal phosphate-dependent enzyme [Fimbriimonadaceae bacterium]|nr:YggS family pyridoxal phosphate-dependent enzyme [Fimbriimonadaceae bacterium]
MKQRLAELRARIERAAETAGRDPAAITLVAVSKTVAPERIRQAYDLGLRHFGESRLQEAVPKIEALPPDIVWHFVGKLQSNKARKAAQLFQVLHTLETESQLRELEKGEVQRPVHALVEINIAQEPQKSGVNVENVDDFAQLVLHCQNVQYRGLMTVGPPLDPEHMRPHFRRLRQLRDRIGGEWLSMGMSADFEVAIQEGASHIRVGSALFGERS